MARTVCQPFVVCHAQTESLISKYENVEIPDKYGAYQTIELEVEYKLWYNLGS